MLSPKPPSPMVRVNLPALHLRAAYWNGIEEALRAQKSRVAAEQQAAAQAKEVAL
jgi:hypothetical protein